MAALDRFYCSSLDIKVGNIYSVLIFEPPCKKSRFCCGVTVKTPSSSLIIPFGLIQINLGLSIVYNFQLRLYYLSLKIISVTANSVDPDELWHNMAFHLGLHCLPKYAFRSG